MEKLRTINDVKAKPPNTLVITWSEGGQVELDLSHVLCQQAYAPLQDAALFTQAEVGDWGHSIVWPGEIELGADSLWRLTLEARGRTDTLAFITWRARHGLSLSATAQALGISRRMVAYYSSGEREVPRTVLLACKGWEVEAA
ncbi:DUF2442 domain-containing protein [Halomonas sp. BM-2019]|uniref:DUF2442 domain-containing protein n=1 Tax=Halomonas sp. BM-2019 TaxID=2811227 RepID=UPI001B3C1C62|nr:MAG: DUF2442 domain-containing protein [Halomonas sp. BM-2019]